MFYCYNVQAMKKTSIVCMCTLLCLTGCADQETVSVSSSVNETVKQTHLKKHPGDAYEEMISSIQNRTDAKSFSCAVNSTYTMSYSDDTKDMFILDGVLEKQETDDDTIAHFTQNIESNGGNFSIEGYYYGGRLYNSYNNVTYYEDMEYSDVESTMLVPMKPYQIPESYIDSMTAQDDDDGNVIYTIRLNNDDAASLFTDRYDTYGLAEYDDYHVNSNKIVLTFDKNGYFISEEVTFDTGVSYSEQEINVLYESSVNYLKYDSTEIEISKDLKKEQKEYVYYEDIDTSSISTDTEYDDSEEDTVTDTFKKRLVNRLGYEIQDDGTYHVSYNDNEAYTIDFENQTFTYSNYTINYVYNWKGEIGTMGSCTYDFKDERTSSECEDSTVEMMKTVESYLEMELYYCGLSLSDLQEES